MRLRLLLAGLVGLVALSVSGCSGKSPTGPTQLNKTGFPLAIGNRWVYQVVTDDPAAGGAPNAPVSLTATLAVTATETVLGVQAKRLEITHQFVTGRRRGAVTTAMTWFASMGDTLRGIAGADVGALAPVAAQLTKPASIAGGPAAWGANILVFPLQVGATWQFLPPFSSPDINLGQKVVEAIEEITVPAGKFRAFRVVRAYSVGGNQGITRQWFAAVGMVKSVDSFELHRRSESGEDLGTVSQTTTMELASHRIR